MVEGDGPSLQGRDWLRVLKFNWKSIKVAAVEKGQQKVEALLTMYKEVFREELGQMNMFEASLQLNPGAKP